MHKAIPRQTILRLVVNIIQVGILILFFHLSSVDDFGTLKMTLNFKSPRSVSDDKPEVKS